MAKKMTSEEIDLVLGVLKNKYGALHWAAQEMGRPRSDPGFFATKIVYIWSLRGIPPTHKTRARVVDTLIGVALEVPREGGEHHGLFMTECGRTLRYFKAASELKEAFLATEPGSEREAAFRLFWPYIAKWAGELPQRPELSLGDPEGLRQYYESGI